MENNVRNWIFGPVIYTVKANRCPWMLKKKYCWKPKKKKERWTIRLLGVRALSVCKKQPFLGSFFACLGVRVRCCSSYRRKTCNRSVLWNLSSYYKGFSLKMCEISPFAHLTATSTLILLKSKVSNPPWSTLKKKRYVLL